MLKDIIDSLTSQHWYNISQNVEIAKGKYAYPKTFKQAIHKIKRISKWQKK
jgi:hypothetical protein